MAGSPFGKYLLFERIAAGGMAEIYRAKYVAAAGVTKSVVIKKILPHYAGNRNFVSMFINEAKIAVGLSHGNIAQVFDFGEIEGEYFIAMEYVHGQTVSKILRRAKEKGLRVPAPYAVLIAMETCRGLHYAHTRVDDNQRPLNIVHRDISPQNIIVSYEGQVKIVDFGIAKARSASEADKTQAGAIKGKYVYFSPEQARARELDGRSDVFATGIVLYEMVCGRLPFEGKMVEVLNRIVRGDFPRPSSVNPELDPQLEAILFKAMATSRDDRYASSLAFQEALAGYLVEVAPRFNQSNLAQLVDYLFQEELAQEGREVQLPESFLSQVARWRDQELTRAPPASDEVEITSAERGSARRSAAVTLDSQPGFPKHTRSAFAGSRLRAGIAVAVFGAAAALGGGAVVYLGRAKTFAVQVTSLPPGAEIQLDGRPTGEHTPATLSNLGADVPHEVELVAPGMQPWSRQVMPARGETVELHAQLEPAPLEPAASGGAAPADDARARDEVPAPTFAPAIATLPETDLRLDAAAIAVSIPASRAARARLDPREGYRLSVEGTATLDGAPTRGCFFFVERDSDASGPAFGWLGPGDSATVRGARVLYGFVVDPAPAGDGGHLTLLARGAGHDVRLVVDSRDNAVFPPPARGGRFAGLSSQAGYALELQGRADFGAGLGEVQSAIYWFDRAGGGATSPRRGILHAGEHAHIDHASQVVLFVPDDDTGDDSGALAASLRPAGR